MRALYIAQAHIERFAHDWSKENSLQKKPFMSTQISV